MDRITDLSLDTNELEKKVKLFLKMHPRDTVELTDLSEFAYDSLKDFFGVNYEVKGIINILNTKDKKDKRPNYTLHIRRKQNA